jgi:hypothetical protein
LRLDLLTQSLHVCSHASGDVEHGAKPRLEGAHALRQRLSRRNQIRAAMRLSPRCAGCAYPRVRSPFITNIFLSQELELGNKDDKVDNKDKYKQDKYDSMIDNTCDNRCDGTDDSGDNSKRSRQLLRTSTVTQQAHISSHNLPMRAHQSRGSTSTCLSRRYRPQSSQAL